jgi:hypothetical protein
MSPRYKLPWSRNILSLGLLDDLISCEHYIRLLDQFIESIVFADELSYTTKGRSDTGQRPYGARTIF